VGPKRVLAPALVALCVGFAVMSGATSERSLVAAGLLCGFGHGFTFPILFGLVVTRTPDENRGTTLALFTALFDLGVLLGGPLFGFVIERLGFSSMFGIAGGGMVCGTLVFFLWDARLGGRARRT
jgi:predicted MFS family arabinose efflux permease